MKFSSKIMVILELLHVLVIGVQEKRLVKPVVEVCSLKKLGVKPPLMHLLVDNIKELILIKHILGKLGDNIGEQVTKRYLPHLKYLLIQSQIQL
ncbi:hypothetical protein [Ligilactobacillus salivarius]|uniref:Secreted protein n=1 Tax=Ligilactobacillus salivarius TaxID=1624 RepID=A0AAW6Q327_9LACO|nr:hypothetical protein [Ligilactobacillus salivarius]MDF4186929.1 hypothetical protein [Ligilactobacillus salivarius]